MLIFSIYIQIHVCMDETEQQVELKYGNRGMSCSVIC